jgi:hypothetical protein
LRKALLLAGEASGLVIFTRMGLTLHRRGRSGNIYRRETWHRPSGLSRPPVGGYVSAGLGTGRSRYRLSKGETQKTRCAPFKTPFRRPQHC